MTSGERKAVVIGLFAVIWTVAAVFIPWESYIHKIVLCLPSYVAVTIGSYAFLKIGHRLSITPEFANSQQELIKDIDRAKDFYKSKGLQL